eukprot:UN24921
MHSVYDLPLYKNGNTQGSSCFHLMHNPLLFHLYLQLRSNIGRLFLESFEFVETY